MATVESGGGPTVRRILLGSQLRRLREARGISREAAGYSIRASESKISRLELGRVSFKERDVADLLTLYGVMDEDERAPLLVLVREANKLGWWHTYADVLPSWFQPYIGLEEATVLIRTYEVQFVPGLFQTEDYARAIITQGYKGISAETVERRINVRMNRQKLVTILDHPHVWVVVDEAALRRPIGGPKVMRAQIEYLVTLTERSNITFQIMPFHFGSHAAEGGAFSILRFPENDLPEVVYLEQLAGAAYLDKREDVECYMKAMNRLCIDSMSPADSAAALGRILSEL